MVCSHIPLNSPSALVKGRIIYSTRNDLQEESRKQAIELLSARLADCIDPQLQAPTLDEGDALRCWKCLRG